MAENKQSRQAIEMYSREDFNLACRIYPDLKDVDFSHIQGKFLVFDFPEPGQYKIIDETNFGQDFQHITPGPVVRLHVMVLKGDQMVAIRISERTMPLIRHSGMLTPEDVDVIEESLDSNYYFIPRYVLRAGVLGRPSWAKIPMLYLEEDYDFDIEKAKTRFVQITRKS